MHAKLFSYRGGCVIAQFLRCRAFPFALSACVVEVMGTKLLVKQLHLLLSPHVAVLGGH